MSCSPAIITFLEYCEKREVEEERERVAAFEKTVESSPEDVRRKVPEIINKAVLLQKEQTRKGGKYKVPGHWSETGGKHTGFISWEEDGETYYVCCAKKDSPDYGKLLWANGRKAPQYPKLTKEKGKILGKILLNYFAL